MKKNERNVRSRRLSPGLPSVRTTHTVDTTMTWQQALEQMMEDARKMRERAIKDG